MTISDATNTRITDQFDSISPERDAADLDALYKVFCVLAPSIQRGLEAGKGSAEAKGAGLLNKTLRMLIVNLWQEPRIPGSGRPKQKHDHNKPFVYPWSEKARDVYFAKKADPSMSTANRLVLEHTHPAKILTERLITLINAGATQEEWTKHFIDAHSALSFVIITKEEDDAISKAGLRSAIVSLEEDPSPLARYRKAGIEGEFISLLDDPRWT